MVSYKGPGHIVVTELGRSYNGPSPCLYGGHHKTLPAIPLAQIAHLLFDRVQIKVWKVQKISGIASIVPPRSKGQVSYVWIIYRTPCHLGHIQLRHPTLGSPAPVDRRTDG